MAHTKIISPSWGWDGPVASPVKTASDGRLRGHDRAAFIKRASGAEHVFMPWIDSVKFAADEEPVHLIALGAKEVWGANRNGDAFTDAVLRACYPTFTKYAKFFRNHKNKPHDGDCHYGTIKAAAYNDKMKRVELLVGLFKTAAAAARDGAQARVADREMEKLAGGKDLAVSMACRVPYDVCSACGNQARTREEYCKQASCPAGGCDQNLTRLIKMGGDFHHLHVENVNPAFFDISDVFKPADRTAYGNKADYLSKMATDGFCDECSTKLAADFGIVAPTALVLAQDVLLPGEWDTRVAEQVKLAHGLAAIEADQWPVLSPHYALAFDRQVQDPFPLDALPADSPVKTAAALAALADKRVVLPLRDFARLTKRADDAASAAACLPGVYGRMLGDGSLEGAAARNPYAPAGVPGAGHRLLAERTAPMYSLAKTAAAARAVRACVRTFGQPPAREKRAAASETGEALARDYAVYKLAALQRIAGFDDDFALTCRIGMVQNQVT